MRRYRLLRISRTVPEEPAHLRLHQLQRNRRGSHDATGTGAGINHDRVRFEWVAYNVAVGGKVNTHVLRILPI